MKKISVIVPTYNEEKYIRKCLEALIKQSRKPTEIIVVDDSTDKTWDIVTKFRKVHKEIPLRIFRTEHKGPAPARNLGARKAQGSILVFVDGDMTFDNKYLGTLVAPIERGEALATFTKEEYVANPENRWAKCWSINSYLPLHLRLPANTKDWGLGFRAIKKDIFLKTKGYTDVGYGEDATVLTQLQGVYAKAAKGAICYHFNPSSLHEVFVQARWIGKGEVIKHSIKSFLIHSFPNSLRRGVVESFTHQRFAFIIFKIVFDVGVLLGLTERMLGKSYVK